jgi:hypothetical protein
VASRITLDELTVAHVHTAYNSDYAYDELVQAYLDRIEAINIKSVCACKKGGESGGFGRLFSAPLSTANPRDWQL